MIQTVLMGSLLLTSLARADAVPPKYVPFTVELDETKWKIFQTILEFRFIKSVRKKKALSHFEVKQYCRRRLFELSAYIEMSPYEKIVSTH